MNKKATQVKTIEEVIDAITELTFVMALAAASGQATVTSPSDEFNLAINDDVLKDMGADEIIIGIMRGILHFTAILHEQQAKTDGEDPGRKISIMDLTFDVTKLLLNYETSKSIQENVASVFAELQATSNPDAIVS